MKIYQIWTSRKNGVSPLATRLMVFPLEAGLMVLSGSEVLAINYFYFEKIYSIHISMATITLEQFQEIYKQQHPGADKWANLEQNQVHTITDFRFVDTKNGESCIITLSDGRSFWACSGLFNKLQQDSVMPKHLVSLGKKKSSKSANQFWAFQMISYSSGG